MMQVKEQEITALREELAKKNKQLSAQESILVKISHIQAQLDATLRKIQSLEVRNNVYCFILHSLGLYITGRNDNKQVYISNERCKY